MNANTLTEALHKKSDEKLRKHIDGLLLPLFNEAKAMPYTDMRKANPAEWVAFGEDYWVGKAMTTYRDLAFLYLRDHWRQKEIQNFISKVEEVEQLAQTLNEYDHS